MTKQIYPENKNNIFNNSFGKADKNPIKKALPIRCHFLLTCLASSLVFLCFSTINAQTNQSTSNSDWTGSYYFSETAPATKRRKSSDVVPSASYEITIEEKNNKLTASFSANGVQLFEAYECSVIIKNNTLEFYFQNLGTAEVQNFRNFKKGDLLFTLTKTGSGKTAKYLFQPAAYKIIRVSQSKQRTPVYFEKPQV
ncbi:MAG TPA: DUF5991 domain-containing protein [Pedobacter sp.]|jgi:hypothetical protein